MSITSKCPISDEKIASRRGGRASELSRLSGGPIQALSWRPVGCRSTFSLPAPRTNREETMSERSGWQLAGRSVVEANERYIMSTFGYAWTQGLVQLASPQEGDRLLDVACGTGPVARQAAPFVGPTGRVVGL